MANRNLVVIGASAGGLQALQTLLSRLPRNFGAAVLVVLHTANHVDSVLPRILGRAGPLPAFHPEDGTQIRKGDIYIAPPNFHMLVEDGSVRVIQGPRENLHRPAIDPLFRTAAVHYGPRVIGIVLTGALDDGTSGLMMVRASGGKAIVQDPATALFPSMPRSALKHVPDAYVMRVENMAEFLKRLTSEELPLRAIAMTPPSSGTTDARRAEPEMSGFEDELYAGKPSQFACPDCGGVLWEIDEHGFLRFRCRVGHAFTAKHLEAQQRHAVEAALWAGLRALEESISLSHRMEKRASDSHQSALVDLYRDRAAGKEQHAKVLRDFLLQVNSVDDEQELRQEEREVQGEGNIAESA